MVNLVKANPFEDPDVEICEKSYLSALQKMNDKSQHIQGMYFCMGFLLESMYNCCPDKLCKKELKEYYKAVYKDMTDRINTFYDMAKNDVNKTDAIFMHIRNDRKVRKILGMEEANY